MYSSTISPLFIVLSLFTHAIAMPTNAARGGKTDPTLGDVDLLNSCPGAAGSPNVEDADTCKLINIVNNPDVVIFSNVGNPFLNCDGEIGNLTVNLGGSSTIDSSITASLNLGVSLDGISLGGGISATLGGSQTVSQSQSFDVSPGRQAILTAGVTFHSQTGNVQVNYPDRINGHFEWFTNALLTQLTPSGGVVEFQVHESACGTNVTDLNNHS